MSVEHTFCGTWEIVECSLDDKLEVIGLEGIKFRLDEMGDITWYNDLINPTVTTDDVGGGGGGDGNEHNRACSESADALFSCETFELINLPNEGPTLLFGAFAGYSIEFKTNTFTPTNAMSLACDGWYTLLCKRLKEEHSLGQDVPFTLISALQEAFFSDGVVKSSEGHQFYIHSPVLRLSGFDCSTINCTPPAINQSPTLTPNTTIASPANKPNQIKISVIAPTSNKSGIHSQNNAPHKLANISTTAETSKMSSFILSPNLLLSPSLDMFQFPSKLASNLSSSFNCLSATIKQSDENLFVLRNPISTSDSNLKSSNTTTSKSIFNFGDFLLNPLDQYRAEQHQQQQQQLHHHPQQPPLSPRYRPPLSPYRSKSPLLLSNSFETPPSSPLTPIAVLQTLPAFMLSPIFQWLYAECLPTYMEEETLEKLINFAESTVPLNKMAEPCRKYLKIIRLKKFVINMIMGMHNCLNRIIKAMNPSTTSRQPAALCHTCKYAVRELAVGCAKVLQFCNIFVKDSISMSRYQRHEIIKYVRSRLPIFLAQCHQLMQNILSILSNLTDEEKTELVVYLVPEIKASLGLMTDVVVEIKSSLEEMCKDLKSTHFERNKERTASQKSRQRNRQPDHIYDNYSSDCVFNRPTKFDIPLSKHFESSAANNLKFVLYIYEVKKMKDIYGRVTMALDIVQQKKAAFNEMNTNNKEQTIRQNLEQLILDIPAYILILENISNSLDEKIAWKEFKFCFKLATSQINGVVSKLLDHRSALTDAMTHICELVQKNQFTQTVIDLGLLEPSNILQSTMIDEEPNNFVNTCDYNTHKLNLIKHLTEPLMAAQSTLSKNALRLLHSGQLSDMEIEIIVSTATGSTSTNAQRALPDYNCTQNQVHTFRAHRVILAARCEWFKKALSSGMQESINKKITLYDTSPVIFRRLLLYLYGAPVDKTVGAEHICELMLLADRFSVDVLKDICETTLKSLIDEDSVLCLLGIGDRYNAGVLKANCFSFISQHGHVVKSDIFYDLPKSLQIEVQELMHWCGRIPEPWYDQPNKLGTRHSLKSPSRGTSKSSRSRKSSPSHM